MKSRSGDQRVAKSLKWVLILAALLLLAILVGLASIALVYLQSSDLFGEA
jgi:hypothetical protein